MDATQEMIALGLCNLASSLVDSMPVSGALSRGAVNHASGVASTAGGLYTGALVLLALQVLYSDRLFYYQLLHLLTQYKINFQEAKHRSSDDIVGVVVRQSERVLV